MNEGLNEGLDVCPFCGGMARVSLRDVRFIGQNDYGDKKIKCAAQVICNKCRARGPVFTAPLINPYDHQCQKSAAFVWMVNEAKNGWNRKLEPPKEGEA